MKQGIAILTISTMLLTGCNILQQKTKVFAILPEDVKVIYVQGVNATTYREATKEEQESIIRWYNSITDYTPKTCCPEEPPADAGIDILMENKSTFQILLRGDRLAVLGKNGWYWVGQVGLYRYLTTVQ